MEEKIIAYIDKELSPDEHKMVELQIAQSSEWQKAYTDLKFLLETMDKQVELEPSKQLSQNFYQFLQKEEIPVEESATQKNIGFSIWKSEWQIAAAVAILLIGVGFGTLWQHNKLQQTELQQLREEMVVTQKMLVLSMLDQSSASSRIKALNISTEKTQMDPQILDAFMHTLMHDENVNVRMKAAEALAEQSNQKYAIAALIKALKTANSPELQITIIDILVELKAKDAVGEFHELLQQDTLMDLVKTKAAYGVDALL